MAGAASATMEGYLHKRQRGLHQRHHVQRTLKFQKRFFHLSPTSLEYFKGKYKQKKGQFLVEDIKIVEKVKDGIFTEHSSFYFQIGSGKEVLYLSAKTSQDRDAWMEALRTVAQRNGNDMLPRYHDGVFTLQKHKWSCCQSPERISLGCVDATRQCPSASACLMKTYPPPVSPIGNRAADWNKASRKIQTAPQTLHWESVPYNLSLSLADSSSVSSCESTQSSHSANPSAGDLTQYVTVRRASSLPELDARTVPELPENCTSLFPKEQKLESSHPFVFTPLCTKPLLKAVSTMANDEHFVESHEDSNTALAGTYSRDGRPLAVGHESGRLWKAHEDDTITGSTDTSHITRDSGIFEEKEEEDISSNQEDKYVKVDSKILPMDITALTWKDNMLVAGSHDGCHVYMWDVADEKLSRVRDVKVSGKVLAVDTWKEYVAIGSTVNQIVDTKGEQWKRYIIVPKDENLAAPPQHLVAFTPTGELATASADSDEIKLWPQPSEASNVILQPSTTIKIPADAKSERISCLSVSSVFDRPWLAVGIIQGKCTKIVRLINMVTKKCRRTFYAGNGDGKNFHIAFSPDGRKIAADCAPDLRIWEVTSGTLLYELKDVFGTTASSLYYSNGGSYVLVGTGTGEVKALSLKEKDPVFTLESPQNLSAATSVACSKDGKFLAVGHENGKLQLWKAKSGGKSDHKYIESSTIAELIFCNEPLFLKVEEKQFDSRGGECFSPDDGYKMVIPEGAIPKGMHVLIQHGVIPNGPFGPFQFPANLKPVSPIVGFSSDCKFEFQKPLQIILPHCIHGATCEDVVFLKAKHTSRVTDDTVPKHIGRDPFQIHFCVCYFLETCIKTCKEQLGSDYEFAAPQMMSFTGRGPDPAIEIQLEQQLEDGWTILHKNATTISTTKVYFWDSQPHDLVLACQQKTYPPRFTLEVHGKNAVQDRLLRVEFQGANEELITDIFLSTNSGQEAVNQQVATQSRPTVCTEDNPSTPAVPSTCPRQSNPLQPAVQPFTNPCISTTRDHQFP